MSETCAASFGSTGEPCNMPWVGGGDQERPRESSIWAESSIFIALTQAMPCKSAIWAEGSVPVKARQGHAGELKAAHSYWKKGVGKAMDRKKAQGMDRSRKSHIKSSFIHEHILLTRHISSSSVTPASTLLKSQWCQECPRTTVRSHKMYLSPKSWL